MLAATETRLQLVRYGITGVASNAVLYILYLMLSSVGLEHKVSMTVVYCVGVLGTFMFNRRWTFQHTGAASRTFWRYVMIYFAGYCFNLASLWLLVDFIGINHQLIMAALILATAALLFVAQKHWVFAKPNSSSERA
jgi:putative flippase GtrA